MKKLTEAHFEKLRVGREKWPDAYGTPASEKEVRAEEAVLGRRIPQPLRRLLLEYGAIMLKCPIYGLSKPEFMFVEPWRLSEVDRFFKEEFSLDKSVLVFSDDGNANPVYVRQDGVVCVWDHDFGGEHVLAPTLAAFVARTLDDAVP